VGSSRASLTLLLSLPPTHADFRDAVQRAERALASTEVYLYCLDDAVEGLQDRELQALRRRGLRLFACAYAAQRRGIPMAEQATFAGLGLLTDLILGTDQFDCYG
jgi:hypothetical protein